MATKTKTPHKSNNHERFLPTQMKDAPSFGSESDEASDAEPGALQQVNGEKELDWEGFDEENEDVHSGSEKEEEGDDDDESMEIVVQKEKPVLPKDTEEEELERLVFGDSAGFKKGLEAFSLDHSAVAFGAESEEEQDEDADFDNVADQDLFFFDTGPAPAPAGPLAIVQGDESEDQDDKPAWEDSDDERIVVSLASVPQLRKLRETAQDDMVNGKEYARRLRKQYERLYPTPDWATHAMGKTKRKRRQTLEDGESDDEPASDMDVYEDGLSTQPLARLLKDADILSRKSRAPAKRRKLQAGTIDIQRLKDVARTGPVCNPSHTFAPLILTCPSPRLRLFHSIQRSRSSSPQGPAQRFIFTMSTRTLQIQTLCSLHYTSNEHP